MRIGVLGTGGVGQTLAAKMASLGHEVMVGTRDVQAALARTEAQLALHRAAVSSRQQGELWRELRDEWDAFWVVPMDDRCMARAVEIGATFGVRIVDAVHLAAADRLPGPVRYLTFERQQIPAADGLGFEVISAVSPE